MADIGVPGVVDSNNFELIRPFDITSYVVKQNLSINNEYIIREYLAINVNVWAHIP